jgi:hypothetical protein
MASRRDQAIRWLGSEQSEREMDYGRLSLSAGPPKRAEISRAPEEQRREGQDRGGHRLRTLPSDRWVNSVAALSCYAICALR